MIFDKKSSKHLPNHVAFIMDGNRRWAKIKKLPIIEGHKKGSEVVKKIVKKSIEFDIKYLTFFSFSTENWNRSNSEIIKLQSLLRVYLESEKQIFVKEQIKFSFIGDIDKFDPKIKIYMNTNMMFAPAGKKCCKKNQLCRCSDIRRLNFLQVENLQLNVWVLYVDILPPPQRHIFP